MSLRRTVRTWTARPLLSTSRARGGAERPRTTRGQCLVAALAWLVLAVAVPVTFVEWSRSAGISLNVVLALLLVALSAARLAQSIAFDRREMVRSIFYVFVYVFLAVPALAQLVANQYPLDRLTYSPSTVSAGLVHVLLGVIAYEVGWLLLRGRSKAADEGGEVATGSASPRLSFSPSRCVLIGAIGLVFVVTKIVQAGPLAFFTSRETTTAALTGTVRGRLPYYMTENKAAGLLMIFLTQILVFVALFAILYARHHRIWPAPTTGRNAAWRVYVAALVVANVVMNNPMGNGRFWFGLVIAAFISIYVPFDRPNSQRIYVCSALLVLFFVFASLDLFRFPGSSLAVSGPGTTFVENGTYAMFQMDLNATQFVEQAGHTHGRQMLGWVFNFVPSQLWVDKPLPTGRLVDPPLARSATAWTELYVDFGVLGVVLFFGLYAAMSRALTNRSRSVAPGLLHAVLPVVALLQIIVLRGSLLPIMGVVYQLVFVFACVTARYRPGQGAEGPTSVRPGSCSPSLAAGGPP